jgi:predicted RNA binding protein YcfA (HicA-like mRNA interferase family)
MAKLPAVTANEVIRGLKKAGFVFDRQAKGSHEIWYNPATKRRTTVPNHPGVDIRKGTLKAILKEAGLTAEEFLELIS